MAAGELVAQHDDVVNLSQQPEVFGQIVLRHLSKHERKPPQEGRQATQEREKLSAIFLPHSMELNRKEILLKVIYLVDENEQHEREKYSVQFFRQCNCFSAWIEQNRKTLLPMVIDMVNGALCAAFRA